MFNLDKWKNLDPKARIIVMFMGVLCLAALIIIGAYTLPSFFKGDNAGNANSNLNTGADGNNTNTNQQLTDAEKKALEDARKDTNKQAMDQGKTNISNPLDGNTNNGSDVDPNNVISQQCNKDYLERSFQAGITANELKCLGCNAAQLQAAGYSAGDLEKAGYQAQELSKQGQFTYEQLREAGVGLSAMKALNADPNQLFKAGYGIQDMLASGYSAKDLRDSGIKAEDLLKAGVPIKDLIAAGYDVSALKNAGVTPEQMIRNGMTPEVLSASKLYSDEAIKQAASIGDGCDFAKAKSGLSTGKIIAADVQGCSAKDLLSAGYSANQVAAAQNQDGSPLYSDKKLYAAGIPADALSNVSPSELKAAGYSAEELAKLGPKALSEGGYSAAELAKAGFTAKQLKALTDANGNPIFSASDIAKAGYSPSQLKGVISPGVIAQSGAYTPAQLLKSGYSLKDMVGKVSAKDLRKAGYTANQLKDAGFPSQEIANAGYQPGNLRRAGISPINGEQPVVEKGDSDEQLLTQGCTDSALKSALASNHSIGFLKQMGCTATQLKQEGKFGAKALHDAGFGAYSLEQAGFSNDDLQAADISKDAIAKANAVKSMGVCTLDGLEQLKDQSINVSDLKAAGCTVDQLKAANYSADQLAQAGFTAGQLKAAGYSDDDLANAGFTKQAIAQANTQINEVCSATGLKHQRLLQTSVRQLKRMGCTAKQLLDADYTISELKNGNYDLQSLVNAGASESALESNGFDAAKIAQAEQHKVACSDQDAQNWINQGFKAGYLKAKQCSAQQLIKLNVPLSSLKDAGYSILSMLNAGVSPKKLIELGYNNTHVANAVKGQLTCSLKGVSLMHQIELKPNEVLTRGCSLDTMRQAGYSAQEMHDDGISAALLLREGGYSREDLIAGSYTESEIPKDVGCTLNVAKRLYKDNKSVSFAKSQGCSPVILIEANYSPKSLNGPYTLSELVDAKVQRYYLKQAGFTDAQIDAAEGVGVCTAELIKSSVAKGKSIQVLKDMPCSAALMHDANIPLAQLLNVYTLSDLIRIGKYTASDFYRSGYSDVKALYPKFFTADQIKRAGYDITSKPIKPIDPIAKMRQEQEKRLNEQERQSKISMKREEMMGATMDMMQKWAPNAGMQSLNVGPSKEKKKASSSDDVVNNGEVGQIKQKGTAIKAASTMFASLDSPINSNSQEPVVATIVAGPLEGAKILGSFQLNKARLALKFSTIAIPCDKTSKPISISAISVNNARNVVVDHHTLERYGSLMASAFISGVGEYITNAQDVPSKVEQVGTTNTVKVTTQEFDSEKYALAGAGKMGDKLLEAIAPLANMPPTVTMREGAVFGLLFMNDFTMPECIQQ